MKTMKMYPTRTRDDDNDGLFIIPLGKTFFNYLVNGVEICIYCKTIFLPIVYQCVGPRVPRIHVLLILSPFSFPKTSQNIISIQYNEIYLHTSKYIWKELLNFFKSKLFLHMRISKTSFKFPPKKSYTLRLFMFPISNLHKSQFQDLISFLILES